MERELQILREIISNCEDAADKARQVAPRVKVTGLPIETALMSIASLAEVVGKVIFARKESSNA